MTTTALSSTMEGATQGTALILDDCDDQVNQSHRSVPSRQDSEALDDMELLSSPSKMVISKNSASNSHLSPAAPDDLARLRQEAQTFLARPQSSAGDQTSFQWHQAPKPHVVNLGNRSLTKQPSPSTHVSMGPASANVAAEDMTLLNVNKSVTS